MIATMVNNPDLKQSILIAIFESENLARMKTGDPATLETRALGGIMETPAYPDHFTVVIGYEEDSEALYRIARQGDMTELLHYVLRGYRFRREIDGSEKAFSLKMGREAEGK